MSIARSVARSVTDAVAASVVGNSSAESIVNLLTAPTDHTDAAWSLFRATAIADTGRTRLQETSTAGTHAISQSVSCSSGVEIVNDVVAAAGERDYIMLFANNPTVGYFFNIASGVAIGKYGPGGDPTSVSVTSLGGGRYRCRMVYTTTGTTTKQELYISTDGAGITHSGSAANGIYLYESRIYEA